jgi:hypothetical protein
MMLTGLADVLRDAGLEVVEVAGWKTRGHGSMTNVHGHTIHHNAGGRTTNPKAGLNTIVNGRSDLPGPLAHTYVDRNGVWYVVAAGLCYHAGVSRDNDYTNGHRIGTEAQAAGDGWSEDWPEDQMASLAIGAKALSDHYGYPISEILGHKETCSPVGRKTDPSFSMNSFRSSVKEADVLTSADKEWLKGEIAKSKGMTVSDFLNAEIELTSSAQVNAMNSNLGDTDDKFKVGDSIDMYRFIRWGGPGSERELKYLRDILTAVTPAPVVPSKAK